MDSTQQRIVTAIIALAIFLSALFLLPNDIFKLFMAVIAVGLSYEWYGVIDKDKRSYGMAATLALMTLIYVYPHISPYVIGIAVFVWFVLFAGLNPTVELPHLVNVIAGPIVISATWSAMGIAQGWGPPAMLHLLLFVWLADTGAYFCGRAFGKTKLAPNISPNKTREGVIGAIVITVTLNYIVAAYFKIAPWQNIWVSLFGGTLLVIISVLGDLYQSQQKRRAGVKDSGTLLPGHGGLWDRLDSLLPVSVFYLLMSQVL